MERFLYRILFVIISFVSSQSLQKRHRFVEKGLTRLTMIGYVFCKTLCFYCRQLDQEHGSTRYVQSGVCSKDLSLYVMNVLCDSSATQPRMATF